MSGLDPVFDHAFDPYRYAAAMHWRNRLAQWRSHPAESVFHATALLLIFAVALALLLQQWAVWLDAARALVALHPLPLALALMLLLGIDQRRARRAQRLRWAQDWLAAQPVAATVRRRRRIGSAVLRLILSLLVVLVLLAVSGAGSLWLWAGALVLASAVGHALGDFQRAPRTASGMRERIVTRRSVLAMRDWQLIEAGAILAPKRLSLLVLVVLLVPRGPAQLALVALLLLAVTAAIGGWLRAVAVLAQAQDWLAAQPIHPRRWVLASLWLPLIGLLLFSLAGATLGALASGAALALLLGVAPFLLGGLHLGVATATRAVPRRAALEVALHIALVIGFAQALPPLVPLVWLLQMAWLLRRGLRR